MDSKELYEKAYDMQYKKWDFKKALKIYEKIIKEFPESKEAEYSKQQIENIKNMNYSEKNKHNKEKVYVSKTEEESKEILNKTLLREISEIRNDLHTVTIILVFFLVLAIIDIVMSFINIF